MNNVCCNCGYKFSNNALFCIKCGEKIVRTIVKPILKQKSCTNCNEKILYNALFCSNCGAKTDNREDKIDINKLVNNITENFRNLDEDNLNIVNNPIKKEVRNNLKNKKIEDTLDEDIYRNSNLPKNLGINYTPNINTYTQNEYLENTSDTYNEDNKLENTLFDISNNIYEENIDIIEPPISRRVKDDYYPQEAYSEGYSVNDEYYLDNEDNNDEYNSFMINSKGTISNYNEIYYEDKDVVNAAIIVTIITITTFLLWLISIFLKNTY